MKGLGHLLEKKFRGCDALLVCLPHDVSLADVLVQDTLVRAIAKQRRWEGINLPACS
jgi:hypothetical protein